MRFALISGKKLKSFLGWIRFSVFSNFAEEKDCLSLAIRLLRERTGERYLPPPRSGVPGNSRGP